MSAARCASVGCVRHDVSAAAAAPICPPRPAPSPSARSSQCGSSTTRVCSLPMLTHGTTVPSTPWCPRPCFAPFTKKSSVPAAWSSRRHTLLPACTRPGRLTSLPPSMTVPAPCSWPLPQCMNHALRSSTMRPDLPKSLTALTTPVGSGHGRRRVVG